ncbi:2-hydroxyacyl-CoA dehydratase subunit D [Candidatus Lokiarchaeum ossiferum]|uniref:2-hydroxyacyl-CoA dehydratase subunit D n=1 Tax=Candidatus Lokiarchaeum ossiferum TaxID=2951803 RepID=UPI00352D1700
MKDTTNAQKPVSSRIRVENLKSSVQLKGIMTKYMLKAKLNHILPWKSTAWVAAGFPVELCYSLGIYPLHPENAACVSGARKVSLELIEKAESEGFSRDLCSYFKTNIGATARKISANLGGIDKPTFMASTNTICDTHVKWFQIQARKMKVPYFAFDVPSCVDGIGDERMEEYIDYVADQFYDFIGFVEKITGNTFSEKKYFEILKKSDRLAELWHEIYEYRKIMPTPVAFQDTLAAIFPMVILPGLDVGIKYYENLLVDIKEKVAKQEGAMPKGTEKYRILFEGIPMWYRIKYFHQLANYGAVVTYEPYTFSFGPRKKLGLSLKESIRDVAQTMIKLPYNYSLERRIKYFEKIIDDYKLNGVILHSNMSCRPSCVGMIDLKNAIQEDKGIPVLLLDCDMNDPRAFSEAPMQTRLEGFIELLEATKQK